MFVDFKELVYSHKKENIHAVCCKTTSSELHYNYIWTLNIESQ